MLGAKLRSPAIFDNLLTTPTAVALYLSIFFTQDHVINLNACGGWALVQRS